jgi:hypothetical protein
MILFHSACKVLAVLEEEITREQVAQMKVVAQAPHSWLIKVYRRQQIAIKDASLDTRKNSQLEEG